MQRTYERKRVYITTNYTINMIISSPDSIYTLAIQPKNKQEEGEGITLQLLKSRRQETPTKPRVDINHFRQRSMGLNKKMVVFCIVVATWAMASMATMEDDEKECADQLANLASCIPFVSGTANKPTPQCCQDTQKVKANKPKCLCVLIKESTDPSMGLPVNTTLALQMPSACSIDAKVSDCPTILNLPPDSPDAKIFKEADQGSTTTSTTNSPPTSASTSSGSPSTASSASSSPAGSSSNSVSKATPSSSNRAKVKVFLGGNCLVLMASISWIFM